MENSMSKVQRLQAERETCIDMAGSYRTSFQHSVMLFHRADKLYKEILEEVNRNAVSVPCTHNR
ncbi:MAG: hypothetical protein PHE09_16640 [Oscillospiraceae bacterium]|nr:hypothetical protein [Oscillospiraceae bacterium]